MLKIYHAPKTRGFRAIWACEELGVPYEIKPVNLTETYRFSSEYLRVNPTGKVPAIVDGDITMFESGAIVQYIINRYDSGLLQPSIQSSLYPTYLQWSWFAEATLAPPVSEIIKHKRAFPGAYNETILNVFKERARDCMDVLDQNLSGPWLLGDLFSGADIMTGLTIMGYQRSVDAKLPSNTEQYFQRLSKRPAFVRAKSSDQ